MWIWRSRLRKTVRSDLALLFRDIHLVAFPAPYSVHYLIKNDCALFSSLYSYCIMIANTHFILYIFSKIRFSPYQQRKGRRLTPRCLRTSLSPVHLQFTCLLLTPTCYALYLKLLKWRTFTRILPHGDLVKKTKPFCGSCPGWNFDRVSQKPARSSVRKTGRLVFFDIRQGD